MKVRCSNLEALCKEVDSYIPAKESLQPPRVGISTNRGDGPSYIAETYVQAVLDAGGAPVLILVITNLKVLAVLISELDRLVMSGGGDINPLYLHEEPIPQLQGADTLRNECDLILLRLAANRQTPIMNICRGHQIMNIAFEGSVYQDVHSRANHTLLKHSQALVREYLSHTVIPEPGMNRLHTILNEEEQILVSPFHHQAIEEVVPGFRATATTPDGINEAMGHTEKAIFSVQWHPEAMVPQGGKTMKALFAYHAENARRFVEAKATHQRIVTIGPRTDTPMIFPGGFSIGKKEGGRVNLPFMEGGRTDIAFMVAYILQGRRDRTSLQVATAYAIERLSQVKRQRTLYPNRMVIATTS